MSDDRGGAGSRALRVLLDARPLQGPTGRRGVGTYVRGLLAGLLEADPGLRVVGLVDRRLGAVEDPPADARLDWLETRGPGPALVRGRLLGPRWARAARADLLHATFLAPPRPPRGVPIVATVHDVIPLRHPDRFTPRQRRAFRWSLALAARATRIAAVSRVTAEAFAALFDDARGRIDVVPPPVDVRRFESVRGPGVPGVDAPYVLHSGGFDPLKGVHDLLLPAFARLAARRPDVRLVLTGHGAGAGSAAAAARDLGLGDRVVLTGHLAAPQLAEAVAGASAVVVSSREEGFGLPVIEAFAAGVPVAIGPAEASREAAAGLAELADADSPEALGAALGRALDAGGPGSDAGEARRRHARTFSPLAVGRRMLACYRAARAAAEVLP